MNFLQKAVDTIFNNWFDQMVTLSLQIIAMISSSAVAILDMPIVVKAIVYTQSLASVILVLIVVYHAIYTYILRMNGDSEADPTGLIKGTIQATAMIWCAPWLLRYIYKIGTSIAYDVTNLSGTKFETQGSTLELMYKLMEKANVMPLVLFLCCLVTVVAIIIVILQTTIRSAELAFTAIAGPLMSATLVNGTGIYGNWWRDVIALSLSQASQILLLKLAFECLKTMLTSKVPYLIPFLTFIGILVVTIKSPQTIKTWVYSSGVGRMSQGAGQSLMQGAMMKVMTKR